MNYIFIKPHQTSLIATKKESITQVPPAKIERNGEAKMGKKDALLLLLIIAVLGKAIGIKEEGEEEWWREREFGRKERFLMEDSKQVIETEAGEMRVMRSPASRILDRPMHIGFITMEPKSLFVPQYLDSSLILFVHRGDVKVGLVYKDELAERRMKAGDVFRIPAGSVFYMVNVGEGQRLQIICSIDKSESLSYGTFQSFFVAGGTYPSSVLAGFDQDTLATAFNVSYTELKRILSRQRQGPIVYVSDTESPRVWSKFLQVKDEARLSKIADIDEDGEEAEKNEPWSWRKLMVSIFGNENRDKSKKTTTGKSPDSYNLYDKNPDFSNAYGWSVALDETEYHPLGHSGIGVYLVNLTAGSMMAPHVNPTAAEYGIVLRGTGTIQIVYPNGTSAMNAEVTEGDVFWIPRYFPFCQIASRTGPFEFFGFTTSSRKNRPQFLAGASSIFHTLRSLEMATAFDITEEDLERLLGAQYEAIILPSAEIAPPHKEEEKRRRKEEERREREREREPETERRVDEAIRSFERNMVMGYV
ncbi:vicilin-like seed storage protein At2g28490 [Benincasa hispida]|uniref:vicilin-like seed storage protein At2g28490 n=1 Tax=Benincasa hispida TaxID=102211 RepID=UPI00190066FB|nr:vicilin-like seed storage protein At2g28490 [Benincasa hispida]